MCKHNLGLSLISIFFFFFSKGNKVISINIEYSSNENNLNLSKFIFYHTCTSMPITNLIYSYTIGKIASIIFNVYNGYDFCNINSNE